MITSPSTRREAKAETSSRSPGSFSSQQAAGEHEYAALQRDVLDRPVEGRGKGVGDVLEDEADGGAFAVGAPQAAGPQVVPVVQALDRRTNPAGQFGRHARLRVDDPRHGLQADARQGGDLAHGGSGLSALGAGRRCQLEYSIPLSFAFQGAGELRLALPSRICYFDNVVMPVGEIGQKTREVGRMGTLRRASVLSIGVVAILVTAGCGSSTATQAAASPEPVIIGLITEN